MSCNANGSKIDDRQCTVRVQPVQHYAPCGRVGYRLRRLVTSAWRPRLVTRLAPRRLRLPAVAVCYAAGAAWVTGCARGLRLPAVAVCYAAGAGGLRLTAFAVCYAAGAAWVTSAWRPRLVTGCARGLPAAPVGYGSLRSPFVTRLAPRGLRAAPVGYGSLRSPFVTRLAPRGLRAAPVGYGSLRSPFVTRLAPRGLPRPGGLGW
jgi:hypothetical protein